MQMTLMEGKHKLPEGENAERSRVPAKNAKLTFMDSLKFNFKKKWGSHNREPQVSCRKIVRVEPFKPEQEVAGNTREVEGARGSVQQGPQVKVKGEIKVELRHQSRRQAEAGKVTGGSQYHHHHRKRKNSFELFLANIPKLDPVDRTVGWVLKHPDSEVVRLCLAMSLCDVGKYECKLECISHNKLRILVQQNNIDCTA